MFRSASAGLHVHAPPLWASPLHPGRAPLIVALPARPLGKGPMRPRSHSCAGGSDSDSVSAAAEDSALGELALVSGRTTGAAHRAWASVLRAGDFAIDATVGNGNDALALARLVGPGGRVLAMDRQPAALSATRALLEASLPGGAAAASSWWDLQEGCHAALLPRVPPGTANLVCFNLGYLPGGDKAVTTRASTTLPALASAAQALSPGGLLSVMLYVGHPEGQEESKAVLGWAEGLAPGGWTAVLQKLVNRPTAPLLLMMTKRR